MMKHPNLAFRIMMVRPIQFAYNAQTASSNAFQNNIVDNDLQSKIWKEFDAAVHQIRTFGIEVIVVEDTDEHFTPDAIFPNNWISSHRGGQLITYPMAAQNRRWERRRDVIEYLESDFGYNHVDLGYLESDHLFLEGTGSMVLDRNASRAYCALGPRSSMEALSEFCNLTEYEALTFRSLDQNGKDIYHTNVMMAIGIHKAVLCATAVPDSAHLQNIKKQLSSDEKCVIDIDYPQMMKFCANILQLQNRKGELCWVMSSSSYQAFRPGQIDLLSEDAHLIVVDIPLIQAIGGGGIRCMIMELVQPN